LQGGFFDHADRLFHSLSSTYTNATTNSADVKELIPEMFYQVQHHRTLPLSSPTAHANLPTTHHHLRLDSPLS